MITYGCQIDQGHIPEVESIAPAYHSARDLDPCFQYLDWLKQASAKIGEIRTDLSKLVAEQYLEKAAKEWVEYLKPHRDELSKELSSARKTKTPAMLTYSGVIVPLCSVLLSEFAKWLWAYFSRSLPH